MTESKINNYQNNQFCGMMSWYFEITLDRSSTSSGKTKGVQLKQKDMISFCIDIDVRSMSLRCLEITIIKYSFPIACYKQHT